jgi:hypothetical protein
MLNLCLARYSYFDTVEVMLPHRLPSRATQILRSLNPGFKFLKFNRNPRWPFGVRLQFPTKAALLFIERAFRDHLVRRLDISMDWITATQDDAEALGRWLQRGLTQRYRGQRRVVWNGDFLYLGARSDSRNGLLYWDRLSKVSSLPAAHIDCRINSAAQCRKLGIKKLSDLFTLDCKRVLRENFRLSRLSNRLVKKRIEEIARRSVRRQSRKHSRRISQFDWNVGRAEWRILSIICAIIGGPDSAPWGTAEAVMLAPVQLWIDRAPRFCRGAVMSENSETVWAMAVHFWP